MIVLLCAFILLLNHTSVDRQKDRQNDRMIDSGVYRAATATKNLSKATFNMAVYENLFWIIKLSSSPFFLRLFSFLDHLHL